MDMRIDGKKPPRVTMRVPIDEDIRLTGVSSEPILAIAVQRILISQEKIVIIDHSEGVGRQVEEMREES